jgi:hypothetical protein
MSIATDIRLTAANRPAGDMRCRRATSPRRPLLDKTRQTRARFDELALSLVPSRADQELSVQAQLAKLVTLEFDISEIPFAHSPNRNY